MTDLEIFERAFTSHCGGPTMTCDCGRRFFDDHNLYDSDWEEEKVTLAANGATRLDYGVSSIIFEGRECVMDCDCWHARAKQVMGFLWRYRHQIGEWYRLKKEELAKTASTVPEVDPHL